MNTRSSVLDPPVKKLHEDPDNAAAMDPETREMDFANIDPTKTIGKPNFSVDDNERFNRMTNAWNIGRPAAPRPKYMTRRRNTRFTGYKRYRKNYRRTGYTRYRRAYSYPRRTYKRRFRPRYRY